MGQSKAEKGLQMATGEFQAELPAVHHSLLQGVAEGIAKAKAGYGMRQDLELKAPMNNFVRVGMPVGLGELGDLKTPEQVSRYLYVQLSSRREWS